MPSKSKTKGNVAELATAKQLSTWFGSDFKRIPNSGALRWNGASFVYGDLLPPEEFPGIIESKFYKDIDLDGLLRLTPQPHNPMGWWLQVVDDVQRCYSDTQQALQPCLVFRANRRPARLMIEQRLFNYCKLTTDVADMPHLSFFRKEMLTRVVIVDLTEFLARVEPKLFVQAATQAFPNCLGEPRV